MSDLLSLSGIARWLNRPERPVRRLVRSGDLVPDSVIGRFQYFRSDRLAEIQELLSRPRGNKPATISIKP